MTRVGGPIGPIEDYASQLKTAFEKHGVLLAYLYGSQATGKAGPLSDVDIAVLFSQGLSNDERFSRVLNLMADLAHIFRRDDVNVLDLHAGTPLLNNNVRLHGRVIYCVDERARGEFILRALQLAIQVVVDIATHILSTSANLTPQDYRDAILKLAEAGVIPMDYANRIAEMAGFRNVLVHQYVNIDPRLVYKNLQEQLDDFVLFGNYVNEWINQNGLLNPPDVE